MLTVFSRAKSCFIDLNNLWALFASLSPTIFEDDSLQSSGSIVTSVFFFRPVDGSTLKGKMIISFDCIKNLKTRLPENQPKSEGSVQHNYLGTEGKPFSICKSPRDLNFVWSFRKGVELTSTPDFVSERSAAGLFEFEDTRTWMVVFFGVPMLLDCPDIVETGFFIVWFPSSLSRLFEFEDTLLDSS